MQPALFRGSGLPARLATAFAAFWAAYPPRKPNPRAMAEAAFARAVTAGAEPEALIRAAEAYAAECAASRLEPAFVVHAATFLRQRRWEDYAAPAEDAAERRSAPAGFDHPLWQALAPHMPVIVFRIWIMPLAVTGPDADGWLRLEAPGRFHAQYVEREFGALIRRATGAAGLEFRP